MEGAGGSRGTFLGREGLNSPRDSEVSGRGHTLATKAKCQKVPHARQRHSPCTQTLWAAPPSL